MTALAEVAPGSAAEAFFAGIAERPATDATTAHLALVGVAREIAVVCDPAAASGPHGAVPRDGGHAASSGIRRSLSDGSPGQPSRDGRSSASGGAGASTSSGGRPSTSGGAGASTSSGGRPSTSGGAGSSTSDDFPPAPAGTVARREATVRPRVRLVPAPTPARPRTAPPPAGPPTTLAERIRVLRVTDRGLDLDDEDDDEAEDDEPAVVAPETDPSVVARCLAGASVEVIAGRRPAAQLARWLAPSVLDALRMRAAITRHAATQPMTRPLAVRGVRVCPLHEALVEATAVVDDGRRVRAIALRLEPHRGAWRATALEVG